jgi:hypothetical protein
MKRAWLAVPAVTLLCLSIPTGVTSAAAETAATTTHVSPFGASTAEHGHATRRAVATHRPTWGPLTPGITEWVSQSATIGSNTSCTSPGYNTISAALLAAPSGATIDVCAGTYDEQLAIVQPVTLKAKGAVTVQGPSSPADNLTGCDADGGSQPNQDVVDICGAGTVEITGFTIAGGWSSSACYDSIYGIAVLGSSSLTLTNSTVESVGGDPQTDGCQGGVGIQVGLATSATTADAGTATLTNDVVNTYAKNGITIDGTGSSAVLTDDTVTGTGPTPAIAQNGIQVSDGAAASITGALVSGDECNDTSAPCGPDALTETQSIGILLFDAGVTTVSSSTVSSSDLGVYNVEDYAWSYYTPPSPFTATNETFSDLTLNNRYENAGFDAGRSTLTGSSVTGGDIGVMVLQYSGQASPPVAKVKGNTISGTSTAAVEVESDQTSGDEPVTLKVKKDNLASNAGGVINQSTSVIKAINDWWGDATGPSSWSFGSGTSVSSDVTFFPWATDSSESTLEACAPAGDPSNQTTTSTDVVLCAPSGTVNTYAANDGSGNVLLLGNKGNDQLIGSSSGETWIIAGSGNNVINGNNGTGYIQERGNSANDTLVNTSGYTIAPN